MIETSGERKNEGYGTMIVVCCLSTRENFIKNYLFDTDYSELSFTFACRSFTESLFINCRMRINYWFAIFLLFVAGRVCAEESTNLFNAAWRFYRGDVSQAMHHGV